jgi:hypothetical protein
MDPDPDPGSIPLPSGSGSGSGRPKNMWIRIRNTARKHTSGIRNPLGCNSISRRIQQQVLYGTASSRKLVYKSSSYTACHSSQDSSQQQSLLRATAFQLALNSSSHDVPHTSIQQRVPQPPCWLITATNANNPSSFVL